MYTEFINPIYGTHDGLEVIVVGAYASSVLVGAYASSVLEWVAVEGDGKVIKDSYANFVVDVRFSGDEWQDVSPGPETPEE
jgi:hypothetical protein